MIRYCYEWACLGRCDAYVMLENEMGNFTAATNKKDYDMVTTIIISKTNVKIDFISTFPACF